MKLYECIVDDGYSVFKTVTASKNKKELLNVYGGNGNFEKVTDVTSKHTVSEEDLRITLELAGYDMAQISLLTALLEEHNRSIK